MKKILFKNARMINRGQIIEGDLFVKDGFIERIDPVINEHAEIEIDAKGKILMPGIIDDQVHFREPGLTHKSDLYTCLLYTSPSPRDQRGSRMPSSA